MALGFGRRTNLDSGFCVVRCELVLIQMKMQMKRGVPYSYLQVDLPPPKVLWQD